MGSFWHNLKQLFSDDTIDEKPLPKPAAAAHNIDIGKKYVAELGLLPARSTPELQAAMTKAAGPLTASAILDFIDEKNTCSHDEFDSYQREFYRLKNKTLDLSLAISGCFDTDYIRKVCNLLEERQANLDFDSILEVGCDCGILSCFLGRMFPYSEITAIDINPEAVENARKLAEHLLVSNVKFQCVSLEDLEGEFEVVFSSRVLMENFRHFDDPPICEPLAKTAEKAARLLTPYAEELREHMNPEGQLFCVERVGRNPIALSWLLALNKAGIEITESFYVPVEEYGNRKNFLAISGKPGRAYLKEDLEDRYVSMMLKDYVLCRGLELQFHYAAAMLHTLKDKLILGVYGFNGDGNCVVKYAVWSIKQNPQGFLFEHMENLAYTVKFCGAEELARNVKLIDRAAHRSRETGIIFVPFLWKEDHEELDLPPQ